MNRNIQEIPRESIFSLEYWKTYEGEAHLKTVFFPQDTMMEGADNRLLFAV